MISFLFLRHGNSVPDCKQFALVSKRFITFFVDSFDNHTDFVAITVVESFLHLCSDPGNPNY